MLAALLLAISSPRSLCITYSMWSEKDRLARLHLKFPAIELFLKIFPRPPISISGFVSLRLVHAPSIIKSEGHIVLFVNHSMNAIVRFVQNLAPTTKLSKHTKTPDKNF